MPHDHPWPAREDIAADRTRLRFLRRLMVFLAIGNGAMVAVFLATVHPMVIGSFAAAAACGYYAIQVSDELARPR